MKASSAYKPLNLALWLAGSALVATGLVLEFRLPPGSRGGRGLSLLWWNRHAWGEAHAWIAYATAGLVLLHLALHAKWLWIVAAKRKPATLVAVLGLGLVPVALALLWPVHRASSGHYAEETMEMPTTAEKP